MNDETDDSDQSESPKKSTKSCKRKQKYRDSYSKQFNGIIESSRGCFFAHCRTCRVDFTISHGGLTDIKRHIETVKHRNNATVSESSKISSFFQSANDDNSVTNAEVLFSEFIIEHSLPISVADHAGQLFKKMFPDSKIVQKYSSGRTKTSYIIDTLSSESKNKIVDILKQSPFSLATDGSTDYEDVKLYPICVRYFDDEVGHVLSVLLSLRECGESSTGENIFKIIENELETLNIPWENLISFATDNASVMVGRHKGVAAFLQKNSPSMYINGCACHLMHLAASKAAKCLPINVEDPLIDIYYYLEKSSKRKQALKELQQKHGLPGHKILKHVPTRWLSLGKCLDRLVVQYPALLDFFEAEVKKEMAKKKTNIPEKRKSTSSVSSKPAKEPKLNNGTQGASSVSSKPATKPKLDNATQGAMKNQNTKSDKEFDLSSYIFKQQALANKSNMSSGQTTKTSGSSDKTTSSKLSTDKSKGSLSSPDSTKTQSKSTSSSHSHSSEKSKVSDKCDNVSKAKKILSDLQNPNTMLYWHFVANTIPIFEKANAFLQNEEPCIHLLHTTLSNQFADIAMRFVKPKCFTKCTSIHNINFSSRENQKGDDELFIGAKAKAYLQNHRECDVKSLYSNVRKFYVAACEYMIKMFPFGEEVLVNAEFLDISKRHSVSFCQVEYFCNRYDSILFPQSERDQLEEEFLHYQCDVLPEDVLEADRIDTAWHLLSQIKDPATGNGKYRHLCRVAKCVLVIYHSNTDCERIFSIVNKNKTEFRSSLSTKTLGNLMTRRMMMQATETKCFATQHSKALLKKCKSATSQGLKE